jgi:RecB family exonuclease
LNFEERKKEMEIELSNSRRETFDSCERKYFYRYCLNLVPKEPKSMAPFFGAAIHRALASWYREGDRDKAMKEFAEEYAQWYDGKDEDRTVEVAYRILDAYFKRYSQDYLEVDSQMVEIGASIDMGFCLYRMRVDMIAKWNGDLIIVDHKTSKYPTSQFNILKPNHQLTGYCLGASEILGMPIRKVMLNILGTALRKRMKEGEEEVTLVRDVTERSEEDFEEFRRGLAVTAQRLRRCLEEGYWPMRTKSCSSFNGCEFLELCKSSEEARPFIMKTLYKESEWRDYEEIY